MFKIALVIFRECLEISLLLGVILAVTKQMEKSRSCVIAGVMLGIIASSIFAFFTRTLSLSFGGMGDELFDSGVMMLAVLLIGWTIVWMQGYGAKVKENLKDLSIKVKSGSSSYITLILLIATMILREGAEIILLVYSIASIETIDNNSYIQGVIIGSVSGFMLGVVIYFGLIKIANQQYIFKISSFLLMFIAAGFAASAVGILTSAGIITFLSNQLWDSSWLVSDRSVTGKILHIVTGYIARPNGLQVLAYSLTIILINIGLQIKILCANNAKRKVIRK